MPLRPQQQAVAVPHCPSRSAPTWFTLTEPQSSTIAQQHTAAATDTPCNASAEGLPIPAWLHTVSSGLQLLLGL